MQLFTLALTFPNIDPVIIEIGPFALRWYAVAYVGGIILGWWWFVRFLRQERLWQSPAFAGKPPLKQIDADDFIVWATIGIIAGGRLGYVFFYGLIYQTETYANPVNWLLIWEGGMSFHGGLLGVILAVIWFSRRRNIDMLRFGDLMAAVAPIGLFFGRLANFINGELYGRVTESPLGMVFPAPGAGPLPRHPSQLYEAFLEGIVLFVVINVLIYRFRLLERRGAAIALFLGGYGMSRAIVEYFFRDSDQMISTALNLSMGTLLSLPMMLAGLLFWIYGPRGATVPAPSHSSRRKGK
ncbi:MAG TPA: prolipoprotein diacylglyceryl transferase [Micropepsaceae bacterium]|nr:prolipoprotein diacylglyceryl transferase [Micropepsaceae bacterium]